MYITVEKNVEPQEILAFLEKINDDVFPRLNSRVVLSEYAEKLSQLADCIIIRIDNHIEGLSAVYCNDFETEISYLTLIAISDSLRKQGFAAKLLNETVEHVKSKGMKKLSLETNEQNQPAVKLYLKYGFKVIKVTENGTIYMDYLVQ